MSPAAGDAPVFAAHGLTKSYGPVRVVEDISFTIGPRQVVTLVGENGAGKSTLFNILSGIVAPDQGRMTLHGRDYRPQDYAAAVRHGVSRVFQEQALVPNIPVYENLLLGLEARYRRAGQFFDRKRMIADAERVIEAAGLDVDVRRRTSSYNFSKRQSIEIARACLVPGLLAGVQQPLILLDEPTSALDRKDEEAFFGLVERLRRQASLLFVSHRMSEVLSLSDVIYVLRDGKIVARLPAAEADEGQIHALMIGREMAADYYQVSRQRQDPAAPAALQAKGIRLRPDLPAIDLTLRRGEIVGIGGLLDSQKSALGRAIAGVDPQAEGEPPGTVALGDTPAAAPEIGRLIAQGLGYIPAERLAEGIIPDLSLAWNFSLPSGYDLFRGRFGLWNRRRERDLAADYIRSLAIRSGRPDIACRRLSGGNQQKVVLARWLVRDPKVLILDNPTRGVDAGAKQEIYKVIRDLADRGVGILLITDELLELIGLSNRILIMQRGRVVADLPAPPGGKPGEQALVELMLPNDSESAGIRPAPIPMPETA